MFGKFGILMSFNKNARLSLKEMEKLQNKKLKNIIHHAYNTSSFYKKKMDDAGINPSNIKNKKDLSLIPFTEKKDIQSNFDSVISSKFDPHKCYVRTTSGSSGKMLRVVWDNYNFQSRLALFYRCFKMAGYSPFKKLLYFLPVPEETGFSFGLFRQKGLELGLPREKIRRTLIDYQPDILSIYPSYALYLAEFLTESDIQRAGIKAISLNSEMILDTDRKIISDKFQCPVYDEYSSVEMGPIASMCPHGNMHTFSDNVIMEIIDKNGNPCPKGVRGEVVLTALNSFAMPFIRYKIGDYSSFSNAECMCGLPFPVINTIEGRKDDSFNMKDGKSIPAWKIYEVVERPLENYGMNKLILKDFFLVQKDTSNAEFHYVKGPDFRNSYLEELSKGASELFGYDFNLNINESDSITRIKTAKRKYIHTEVGK